MNIYYNGACFFNVKIEEVICFYFCDHFYKSFKEKKAIKKASVLQSHPRKEVITYCCDCQEKIRKICLKFDKDKKQAEKKFNTVLSDSQVEMSSCNKH